MLFPKSRMRFASTYAGKTEPEGWLALDLKGFDLDGVTKLYLPMEDVLAVKEGGDTASDRLRQARALLGGEEDGQREA